MNPTNGFHMVNAIYAVERITVLSLVKSVVTGGNMSFGVMWQGQR